MVAPVLCMEAAKGGKRVERALGWQELADSTCRKRDLSAAETDVPVDVVFEDEGGLEARIEEPGHSKSATRQSKHSMSCCSQGEAA